MESFLYNQFILQYGHRLSIGGEPEQFEISEFHFDNIVKMKADLGTGLYTEGTGNLANVKGATNPVYFTFRQTLRVKDGDSVQSYRRLKRGFTNPFSISVKDGTSSKVKTAGRIVGGKYTVVPDGESSVERSIFKWAEMINGGSIDRAPLTIYGSIGATVTDTSEFIPFISMTNAIPLEARIKRNPYIEENVAELDFVADAMSFFDAGNVFEEVTQEEA